MNDASNPSDQAQNKSRLNWFFRPSSMFLMFMFVGPLMLPAVWFHPQYSNTKKIVISVIVIGLMVLLTYLSAHLLQFVWTYYKMISEPLQ